MVRNKFSETVSEWSLQDGPPTDPLAGAFYADTWKLSQNNFFHLQIILGFGIYDLQLHCKKRSRNVDRKRHKKIRIIAQPITCREMILLPSIRCHMPLQCGV